ncbi:MAG: ATP-binding cassette domain-containing protein [Clostridia bacterium]|nr:ATP-binding cassette domain-containing protein [Clostridia bacterium]
MIRVENLTKRYGKHYALNDISFEIKEGEIVGLLGPNGAGKSTTMNILTGYLSATSGSACIDGINVLENPTEAKRKIGYLPEQPPLYHEMTVMEYLNFVYELKGCAFPREPHLAEIADVVKIRDVKDRLIGHLSKGYKQRVGIAAALVNAPPVLIFDEPTVGLDPQQIIEVRNLLRSLGRKHTIILSTHILPEVQAVCEKIIVIHHGHIIANEKTEDITREAESFDRFRLKICGPSSRDIRNALQTVNGVRHVEVLPGRDAESYAFLMECERGRDVRKPLFRLCADRDFAIIGLEPVGTDLEDIFVRLVEKAAKKEGKGARKK